MTYGDGAARQTSDGGDLGSENLGSAGWSRRAVLLTGLLVAGCGGSKRPTIESLDAPDSRDPVQTALREMLDRRAKAVRDKDEAAFLAGLDRSNGKLIAQQKMLFANLVQLPFKDFRYITDRILSGRQEGETYRIGPVVQVTQLTVDDGPGGVAPAETFQYSARLDGDTVVVTDIVPITVDNYKKLNYPSVTQLMADAPWNFTPLKVREAGRVILVGDKSVPDLEKYAAAAKSELGKVEALWGDRVKFPGYILFFTRERATLKKWFGLGASFKDVDSFEGVEIPLSGVRKNGEVYNGQYAGSRIVVNLANTERWDDDPRYVMRHELTHAVTARATTVALNGFIGTLAAPRWAVEGFARYVEVMGNASRSAAVRYQVRQGVARGKFKGKPPLSKTFYGKDIGFNYAVSATVFSFVERLKGRDAAVEFYAKVIAYSDSDSEALVDLPAFDGICKRVVGLSGKAFVEQWASYVRRGA